jgi:hypothetical protein
MKKVLILAAVLMLFAAGTANAAIDGSRHDMGAMGGSYSTLVGAYGDCSACHLPHKALGAKLWAEDMSGKTFDATFGTLAVLCSYCHDGTTISAAVSANLGYGPFASAVSMSAHGMNVTLTPTNGTGGSGQADVEASTLPYTAAGRPGGNYMECTSCHDVHNANSNRPFLSVGGAGDIGLANLCNTCHTGRMSTGAGTPGEPLQHLPRRQGEHRSGHRQHQRLPPQRQNRHRHR